ncbi:MAG TPA: hypothetical protein VM639_00655 [Dongiaceae bacterium]|nr:hypothetical protein [Dongiaceae bacterium]
MKEDLLGRLEFFKASLKKLKLALADQESSTVSRKPTRDLADTIASYWVENLRSPLEHKVGIEAQTIVDTAAHMKRLHQVSRPNNLKSSYLQCINGVLSKFDDKFVLPIKQTPPTNPKALLDLRNLLPDIASVETSSYLEEAINCALQGFYKASIVMGWCAAIDRIQERMLAEGFTAIHNTSVKIKDQKSGKFKRWDKVFNYSTKGELQTIFDTDLIVLSEGFGWLDGNQASRLEACFDYRCQSAHPGEAPIEKEHVLVFFKDITAIVLTNPKFKSK